MSNGKGYALVIVSLIIGAIGVGMGTYSALNFAVVEGPQGDPGEDGTDGVDGLNGTLNNVIGIWESIEGGPNPLFALNFSDDVLSENGFFTLDLGYNLTLIKAGWYHFHIKFKWVSLASTEEYNVQIAKNGIGEQILVEVKYPVLTTHIVDTDAYVYSDGNDYFQIGCFNIGLLSPTSISSAQYYNQFVLEYVKEA